MFRRGQRSCRLLLFFLCLIPSLLYSSASNADVEQQYNGKILTLRQFYPGPRLRFDSSGQLQGAATPGAWTTDGQLRVEEIALKNGVIHLQGHRLFLFYDQGSKQLRDLATISKEEAKSRKLNQKFIDNAVKLGKVEVEVETGMPQPEMADVAKAMNAVFLAPDEPVTSVVPAYWKSWLEGKAPSNEMSREQVLNLPNPDGSTYRVGKQVSPPHVNYYPDPAYSEVARKLRYQGTVVLWLVVDKEGQPTHIRIQRALGMGLDDAAVATVGRWKFTPAKKDGEPVPVMINVEVNFRLY
jgi:TonB family protein